MKIAAWLGRRAEGTHELRLYDDGPSYVCVLVPRSRNVTRERDEGTDAVFTGRVRHGSVGGSPECAVDTTASRFHPASIGGLVVGAMGVFVFAVYMREWLRARRAA